MVLLLINKMMDTVSQPSRFGAMIQYQKRCDEKAWKTFHLAIREDDYEYLLDLRKLLKMSVSLIITYAIKKYVKKSKAIIYTDNNRYKNYAIIKERVDNIICWRLFWGYPPGIEKYITH